jgi:hypothetical protein
MMLATWLTEIYLAKINELEDLAGSDPSAGDEAANIVAEQQLIEDELQQFLRTYKVEFINYYCGNNGPGSQCSLLSLIHIGRSGSAYNLRSYHQPWQERRDDLLRESCGRPSTDYPALHSRGRLEEGDRWSQPAGGS